AARPHPEGLLRPRHLDPQHLARADERSRGPQAQARRRAALRGVVMATETETGKTSRVGKRPVPLPKGVSVSIANGAVQVKGPKGELSRKLIPRVEIKAEGAEVNVTSSAPGRDGSRLQG